MVEVSRVGAFGVILTVLGVGLLLGVFYLGFREFTKLTDMDVGSELQVVLSTLLYAAAETLFLGVMGWVGVILLSKGIEFIRVEEGRKGSDENLQGG